jgi:hypothetical protein
MRSGWSLRAEIAINQTSLAILAVGGETDRWLQRRSRYGRQAPWMRTGREVNMTRVTIPLVFAVCLCLAARAEDQNPVEKAGTTVENGAKKTGRTIQHGAQATGRTVEHGAQATGRTLKHGTQATERTVGKEFRKTGNSLERAGGVASRSHRRTSTEHTYASSKTAHRPAPMSSPRPQASPAPGAPAAPNATPAPQSSPAPTPMPPNRAPAAPNPTPVPQ